MRIRSEKEPGVRSRRSMRDGKGNPLYGQETEEVTHEVQAMWQPLLQCAW